MVNIQDFDSTVFASLRSINKKAAEDMLVKQK